MEVKSLEENKLEESSSSSNQQQDEKKYFLKFNTFSRESASAC